uniref:Uncharacterized protein n=1 Tax=Arundo donax TaxID=35708 RepID=A0A0A9A9C0_ARUDO
MAFLIVFEKLWNKVGMSRINGTQESGAIEPNLRW